MRCEVVEDDENGVIGFDRIHIIDLNHVARPIKDIPLDTVIVDSHVDEVDDGVRARCDANGRSRYILRRAYKLRA